MKIIIACIRYCLGLALVLAVSGSVGATMNDGVADLVLGQPSLTRNSVNTVDAQGLYNVRAVSVDQTTGRVYVCDYNNHRVLWWNTAAAMGDNAPADGVLGQADFTSYLSNRGTTVAANTLRNPMDVSVDAAGDVWVADTGNNRVLKYAAPLSNGMNASQVFGQADFVSRTANRGGAAAANTLSGPRGVRLSGVNLLVADYANHRVLRYTAPFTDGMAATLVLGQANFTTVTANRGGAAAANTLNAPTLAIVDSGGDIVVSDTGNNRVLRYSGPFTDGMAATLVLGQANFTTVTANRGAAVAANALYAPAALIPTAAGSIWVCDVSNNRILRYDAPLANGMNAVQVLGQADFVSRSGNRGVPVAANSLSSPTGIALEAGGDLWAADYSNHRVIRFPAPFADGMAAVQVFGNPTLTNWSINTMSGAGMNNAQWIAFDAAGRIFVTDITNNRVLWWNSAAALTNGLPADGVLGQADLVSGAVNRGGAVAANTMYDPHGLLIDASGNLWVSEWSNCRVLRFSPPFVSGMNADLVLGQADFVSRTANRGGAVAANTLGNASQGAFDAAGNLWIADAGNNRVLKFLPPFTTGMSASLVLGQADMTGGAVNRGGAVAANTMRSAFDVDFDDAGNLWVSDHLNNRILRFTPPFVDGMDASLVLGQADFSGGAVNRGGTVGPHTMYNPRGNQFDAFGNLWVADGYNNRVLKFTIPLVSGMDASLVLGQSNSVTNTSNRGGAVAGNTLSWTGSVTFDDSRNMWVAERTNNRVLRFNYIVTPPVDDETVFEPVPNPFYPERGSLTLVYDMAHEGKAVIDVYDIAGNLVAVLVNGDRAVGRHTIHWTGANGEYDTADGQTAGLGGNMVAKGVYVMRYKLGGRQFLKKVAVIR